MVGSWANRTVVAISLTALLTSGGMAWGDSSSTPLVSVDSSWSIRKASVVESADSVKLTVLLRKSLSRRISQSYKRHLWIEVDRNNSAELSGSTVDLNLMQRAYVADLPLEDGRITKIRVEYHDDHRSSEHS